MQQRSEETRARILQAAAALFSQNGYDASGVAELCARAGVSKGAFYHHFPSKQAVFLALLDAWLAALDAQMAEIVQGATSIPQALVRMSSVTGSVFRSAGGQLPMFLEFWRESSHDPRVWEATIAPYRRYQQAFAALLRQGAAEGSLRPVDPERAAQAIVALALGLILQGVIDPQGAAWDEVAQDSLQWMMDGLSPEAGLILVTGATGHIGNVLVRELATHSKKPVRALVFPGEDTSALADLPVEFFLGDVLDPESLVGAMQGVEVVYHLAGIISILPGRDDLMWRVNVEGTQNVLRAARQAGVRRLVYTSSIHALERAPHGVTIDETLSFNPDNPGGEYDRTKAAATLAVMEAVREGLDAVIACPTGVIGPHDYRTSELGSLFHSWMKNRMVVLTDGIYDFTDVRDVARGLVLACEHGRSGEAYILGGERTSLARLWAMVGEVAGFQAWSLFIPFSLAMAAARIMPFFYRLFRQKPAFTPYSLDTVRSNSFISHAKAARELGYLPRPLVETIRDTVSWWRERALVK